MITPTELTAYKIEAYQLAENTRLAISALCQKLNDIPAEKFFSPHLESGINKEPTDARRAVISAYRHIFYDDEQKPNESRFFVGAVVGPRELLPLVKDVNQQKAALNEFLRSIRDLTIAGEDGFPESITARIFENSEYVRLHRLQATRSIHVLSPQPKIVSFTLRTSPQVVKLTRNQVLKMLHNNDRGTAEDNYAKSRVFELPEDEILAWRKPIPPKPRANVIYENSCDESPPMTPAVLPLFIVDEGRHTVIKSNPMDVQQALNRQNDRTGSRRRASKLTEVPLVVHPEIYRYRANVQHSQAPAKEDDLSVQTSDRSSV